MLKGRKLSELYLYLTIVAFVSAVTSLLAITFESNLIMLMPFIPLVAEVFILFKLGDYSDNFLKGCILNFIGSLVFVLFMIAGVIIKTLGIYYMIKGHSGILKDIDDDLMDKWKMLFLPCKIAAIVIAVFTVIMFAFLFTSPFLVRMFIILAWDDLFIDLFRIVTIYLIVVKCLEVYFLYRTYQALSRYDIKENVD